MITQIRTEHDVTIQFPDKDDESQVKNWLWKKGWEAIKKFGVDLFCLAYICVTWFVPTAVSTAGLFIHFACIVCYQPEEPSIKD